MRYDAGGCAATAHTQADGKVICDEFNGGVTGASPVFIVAGSRNDMNHKQYVEFFSGPVLIGDDYVIDGALSRRGDLVGNTTIFVFKDSSMSTLLERVTFHTSCSQPLLIDDHYGSHVLVGFSTTNGTVFPTP